MNPVCLKIMIEKVFKLNNEPNSVMLQGKLFQRVAPLKTLGVVTDVIVHTRRQLTAAS